LSKRATLVWTDAQGEATVRVTTTDTGIGGIETALSNHSNAVVVTCSEGVLEVYSVTPIVATYSTVRVTAQLNFASATGSLGRLWLPSPKSDIFLSDGDTVDPSAITDITSAAIGHLICGDGTVAATFTGGTLIKTPLTAIATLG
jgi:hypothetical protein